MAVPVAAWLMSMAAPLAVRVVTALGFTAVTFAGVTTATNQLVSLAQSHWSSMPVSVLQIATLSGIPESVGMVVGAYVARLAVWSAMNGTKLVFKGGAGS